MLHNRLRASSAGNRGGIPTDGLIAWYTMDNISGSTLVDEMGNYNGTLNGTFTSTGGIGGANALLADSTSSYVSIPNLGTWFRSRTSLGISAWIKPNSSFSGAGPQFCVSFSSHDSPFYLQYTVFKPTIQVYASTSNAYRREFSTSYSTTEFHHVLLDFYGGGARVFVNNTMISDQPTDASMPSNSTSTAMLGRIPAANSTSNAQAIHQCQMRIYDRSLNDAEITQLYNEGA